MIKSEDVGFHTPANVNYDWAETTFFSVYVPEANMVAFVYTVARPGVGAFVVDIEAFSTVSTIKLDSDYIDFQQHLPMPDKLENYSLPNGLKVQTFNEPRGYRIDYIGVDDTELNLEVSGLMEPYDIHDPEMDPLASDKVENTGFGAAYSNHFDMTAHVTGTIKIRGRCYDVDCVTTMDHSWGPRNERWLGFTTWMNANFDKKTAFQMIWKIDHSKADWDQFQIAHGYALVDGKVRGLKAGRLRAASRNGPFPTGYEAELVDVDGTTHSLVGNVIAQTPWDCYSNLLVPFSSIRWHYKGAIGQGLSQESWPLDRLSGRKF